MLAPAERMVFTRLGVLADGFDDAAASAVAGASPDDLAMLARKSLLVRRADGSGGRIAMLETIREYALERLAADGALHDARAVHAAYYVDLAERAEEGMRGPDQVDWTTRVEAAHDNLRAALACLAEQPSTDRASSERRLRLAAALSGFWYRTGRVTEGAGWLEQAIDGAE